MERQLQVVTVGAGYFAQFHIEAWQRLEHARLAAIVEVNTANHATLKAQHKDVEIVCRLDELSFNPDIVDIASPPSTHAEQITCALETTQAMVICQKPFCGSLAAAERVVENARILGRTIVVHENFRFQPWYRKIKSLLDQKLIGSVQQATFRLRTGDGQGALAYLDRQPYFQNMPRFLIHETGIHFIDVFRYLFGEPDSVTADLRQLNPSIRGEDAGFFTFQYKTGMRALFDGNRHLDHAATNTRFTLGEMIIEGTGGSITLRGNGDLLHRKFGSAEWQNIAYHRNDIAFAADCVYLLQAHVVEHLTIGSALENSAEEYLKNQRLEELVYRANDEKSQIPVL